MRFVLDTTILVAAIRSDRGASRRLLVGAFERTFTTLISVPLMLEYEAVMTRSHHLEASGLTSAEVNAVLDALAVEAEAVSPNFRWRPAVPDPDDDMIVELAVNGRADAVVTFNDRHMSHSLAMFGVATLRPGQAVQRLEGRA